MRKPYTAADKNKLLIELDEFGDENATLYVEALDAEHVKMLRVLLKLLNRTFFKEHNRL